MADKTAKAKKGAKEASGHIQKHFSKKKTSASAHCLAIHRLTCAEVAALVKKYNNSGFSDELIICEIYKESTFNSLEQSSVAKGLIQMTRGAIKEINSAYKKNFTFAEMSDPAKAVEAGTLYLKYLKAHYDLPDAESTLNAYRYGPNGAPPKHDVEHYAQRVLDCEKCLKANPENCDACTQAINPPKPKAKKKHSKKKAAKGAKMA